MGGPGLVSFVVSRLISYAGCSITGSSFWMQSSLLIFRMHCPFSVISILKHAPPLFCHGIPSPSLCVDPGKSRILAPRKRTVLILSSLLGLDVCLSNALYSISLSVSMVFQFTYYLSSFIHPSASQ
jgi:hypothetical protein